MSESTNLFSADPLSDDELREVRVTLHRMRLLWAVWGWLANAVHDWRAIMSFAAVTAAIWGPDIARALIIYLDAGQ